MIHLDGVKQKERLDACLKFIERAKASRGGQSFSRDRVVRGAGEFATVRSEATSIAPVPPVGFGGVADAADEIRRLRAHISLLESGSVDMSREVMRQKKAKTLNAPSPDLVVMNCVSTQLVSPEDVPVPR